MNRTRVDIFMGGDEKNTEEIKVFARTSQLPDHMIVPKWVLQETRNFLFEVGHPGSGDNGFDHGNEGAVMWYGYLARAAFITGLGPLNAHIDGILLVKNTQSTVASTDIPDDIIIEFDQQLDKLKKNAKDNAMFFISFVHSHPGMAFSSGTDTRTLLAYGPGMFSLIIPNFARSIDLLDGAKLFGCKMVNGDLTIIELDLHDVIQIVSKGMKYGTTTNFMERQEKQEFVKIKGKFDAITKEMAFFIEEGKVLRRKVDMLAESIPSLAPRTNDGIQCTLNKQERELKDQADYISRFESEVAEMRKKLRHGEHSNGA